MGGKKILIEDCHKLAELKGGKCLSTEYVYHQFKLKWECSKGHIWDAVFSSIKQASDKIKKMKQEKYDEILNLKDMGLKSLLLLPVGYRAADDMFASFKKVRKDINKTIIELN